MKIQFREIKQMLLTNQIEVIKYMHLNIKMTKKGTFYLIWMLLWIYIGSFDVSLISYYLASLYHNFEIFIEASEGRQRSFSIDILRRVLDLAGNAVISETLIAFTWRHYACPSLEIDTIDVIKTVIAT